MEKLKILELFAGIGACSTALKRIGMDLEIVDAVEIDKYAIASFNAIHGTAFEPQDITQWDKDLEVDIITHGSPCQDFSVAGRQAGGDEGSGTRSSLLYETLRIVEKLKPKYVLWENVKNILSKKHRHNFDKYLEKMEQLGYTNYYKVLNAKDYGIPQNRERVYTVSIRYDYVLFARGENNSEFYFEFPKPEELKLRLKDILENNVDEKYYLSDTGVEYFKNQAKVRNEKLENFKEERILTVAHGNSKGNNKKADICPTLDTQFSNNWRGVLLEPKCIKVGELDIKGHDCIKRIYSDKGISPILTDMQGGNRQPKIVELPCIGASRGRNPDNPSSRVAGEPTEQRLEINTQGTSNCLTSVQKDNYVIESEDYKIRKLTPRECWRLQGFSDEDFNKAKESLNNIFYGGKDK